MLDAEDWMNIHVLSKQSFSYTEIGRLIGRDWRTVKRALTRAYPPCYQRAPQGSRL